MGNNFEEHIKNSMDNPPEFPFEERLWNDMESRLDNKEQTRPFSGLRDKLPLLLLALLTTSLAGYFYVKQYKAMERIAAIEEQHSLNYLSTEKEITTSKHVTVIYDTIYNKIVINQYEDQGKHQNNKQQEAYYYVDVNKFNLTLDKKSLSEVFAPTGLSRTISFTNPYTSNIGLIPNEEQEYTSNSVENKGMQEAEISTVDYLNTSLVTLPGLQQSFFDIDRLVDMPSIEMLKKKKRKKRMRVYLNQLKPTRFALAGGTGTFASLNLGGNGFNLRGIAQAEVGLGKRFSLITGIEYFSNDFNKKIEPDNPDAVEGFPDLPPNNAEDVLQEIQGDFNYLQVPLGFKYIVFPKRYFYPYVGAGVIAGKTARSRLEYEYLATTGPYSISEGKLLPRTFELSAYWTSVGFQVRMNKHWSLLLEGSSQFGLKKGTYRYENLQLLKLSTGVQYQF